MEEKTLTLTIVVVISLMTSAVNAQNKIYRHVSSDGHITYANKPMKGANKFQVDAPLIKPTAIVPSFQGLPAVTSHTQKKRDGKRRQILENELALEVKLLTAAQRKLDHAKNASNAQLSQSEHPHQNEVKQAQALMSLHERNIGALNKELASL